MPSAEPRVAGARKLRDACCRTFRLAVPESPNHRSFSAPARRTGLRISRVRPGEHHPYTFKLRRLHRHGGQAHETKVLVQVRESMSPAPTRAGLELVA